MRVFGRSTLSEIVADRVVYRNLVPYDRRLPSLDELRPVLGLPGKSIPRKTDLNYAVVITNLLKFARKLDNPGGEINRLIFVGDTRLLDGTSFENICQTAGWPGMAFIGSENELESSVEIARTDSDKLLFLANRWSSLPEFDSFCRKKKFVVDDRTAVVIDIDKTAIGARGRNSHVIDRVRVEAVENTVSGLLGENFNSQSFKKAYERLNEPEFHPFTTDNQDYLAYICLILGTRLFRLEDIVEGVHSGSLKSFDEFITGVDNRRDELPDELIGIHTKIYTNLKSGDPTPFKEFRRNEYLETIRRMGQLGDEQTVETLVSDEIVITQEVLSVGQSWIERGALIFSLSDKPDEASIPTGGLSAQGYKPIHQTETHVVGEK
jgi:hypothetical protein